MMNTTRLMVILISCVLMFSCATQKLWKETDPNDQVLIFSSEITEQQLIDKQIPYQKWKSQYGGSGYLIPKSKARQLGDYTVRMFVTPITVTIDAVTVITVVGVVVCLNVLQIVPATAIK